MVNKELKNEAKSYAKRKFNEEEQAYLHDIIAQAYYDGAKPREKQITIDAERIVTLQETNGSLTDKVNALEAQIEKMKKYAKLLQDICVVLGNDNFMVAVQLESVVKNLWDTSEEKEGLKMVEDIKNRLLKIKPQEWLEITKWEIKEND